jgi:hypothetical protein
MPSMMLLPLLTPASAASPTSSTKIAADDRPLGLMTAANRLLMAIWPVATFWKVEAKREMAKRLGNVLCVKIWRAAAKWERTTKWSHWKAKEEGWKMIDMYCKRSREGRGQKGWGNGKAGEEEMGGSLEEEGKVEASKATGREIVEEDGRMDGSCCLDVQLSRNRIFVGEKTAVLGWEGPMIGRGDFLPPLPILLLLLGDRKNECG